MFMLNERSYSIGETTQRVGVTGSCADALARCTTVQMYDLVECVYEIQRVERIVRSNSRNLDVLDYGRILFMVASGKMLAVEQ